MSHKELVQYFESKGLDTSDIHMGPEHPAIEQRAIDILKDSSFKKRVLEIGYQSGAFAVPVILEFGADSGFEYAGIDNMAFNESINSKWTPDVVKEFLISKGVPEDKFTFNLGDAQEFLNAETEPYDLILIDHLKPFYARELRTILQNKLIKADGVILLHDVSVRAARVWKDCERWCWCYGCESEIDNGVVSGLAIVKSPAGFTSKGFMAEAGCRVVEMIITLYRLIRLKLSV